MNRRQNVAPYQRSNPKAEPISTLLQIRVEVAVSAETPLPICGFRPIWLQITMMALTKKNILAVVFAFAGGAGAISWIPIKAPR